MENMTVYFIIGIAIMSIFAGISYFEWSILKDDYKTLKEDYEKIFSNYTEMKYNYSHLQKQYNVLQRNFTNLQSSYNSLQKEYMEYKNKVEMRIPSGSDKCKFITPDDLQIKTKTASVLGNNFDGKLTWNDMGKINKWISKNIKYNRDVYVGKKGDIGTECWQYPNETLKLKYGDCEDHALLMISMCLAEENVKWIYCAEVEFQKGNEKVGHVCIFINVENDQMFIFDPTNGWDSGSSKEETKAMNEYCKNSGYNVIRIKSVFGQNTFKTFNSNEEFYNWF